jgi:uncharacterized protein YbjT (DUF2867 family)
MGGATGLVGKALLNKLLELAETETVFALSRKEQTIDVSKIQWLTGNYLDFKFPETDVLFIALGTTMTKAGSKDAFWKTDVELPLSIAKKAMETGCKKIVLVSAKGANARSSIFYNKAKGSLEEEIQKLGFDSVIILRPSLLLGNRAETRPGEWLARKILGPIRNVIPKPFRPIKVEELALKMVEASHMEGIQIIENENIF